MRKLLLLIAAGMIVGAFLLSPWPGVFIIRALFDKGAAAQSARLEKHVPQSIRTTSLRYDPANEDAVLDIDYPPRPISGAPTIVWVHGGGFVSGRRGDVANYLKILAGQGFHVVNVDYTIAPAAHYPTPVRQLNRALAYLGREGGRLGVDPDRLVLAGDSAGAQIAAQTAVAITNADYARRTGIAPGARPAQIVGVLLYCGVYDITRMGGGGGLLGWFVHATTWAYSGRRNWRDAPGFEGMSIGPNLSSAFPPAFISAGNADPLAPQSVALADALRIRRGRVETLFFPADYRPRLGHEYQFDLDSHVGRLALARSTAWLNSLGR